MKQGNIIMIPPEICWCLGFQLNLTRNQSANFKQEYEGQVDLFPIVSLNKSQKENLYHVFRAKT